MTPPDTTLPRLPPVDHLVWGGRSLTQEIERLEQLTGVRPVPGGRHPNEGTHNALLGLGPAMYLELIAPDPDQAPPSRPRWFGLDALTAPRLVTWAAKSADLEEQADAARAQGLILGGVRSGRRELANGESLSWRLTYPDMSYGAGLIPFLIDWGESRHPAGQRSGRNPARRAPGRAPGPRDDQRRAPAARHRSPDHRRRNPRAGRDARYATGQVELR